jgi:hypothetical protein
MMKTLFLCLLLSSISAQAVTVSFLNMQPDQRFMNFALEKYLTWLQKNVPSSFKREALVDVLLKRVDHWVVPEHSEFAQFTVGFKVEGTGKVQQTYRIFIHPDLRTHPLLLAKKLPPDFDPWFLEQKIGGRTCFIGQKKKAQMNIYDRLCDGHDDGQEIVSSVLTPWKNPFPLERTLEIRRVRKGQVEEISYVTNSAHPRGVTKELYPILNLHGTDGLLSLDKYSIDAHGKMTIYYP